MTDPPIWTVDKEAVAGIIETGKPAGLYMCESVAFPGATVSARWTGVDSRKGRPVVKKHGAFPDVLTWLMTRAGIIPKKGTVLNLIRTGEPEYHAHGESRTEIRIEGAAVREWTAPYTVTEITGDGWGKNTIKPGAKRRKRKK